MKKIFSKLNVIRASLFVVAVIAILLIMPRTDHHSYVYDINHPWRYPLLTAAFDVPIMSDSTTIKSLKDSIDNNFVPFVVVDNKVAQQNIDAYQKNISTEYFIDSKWLIAIMTDIYNRGIVPNEIYSNLKDRQNKVLRTTHNGEQEHSISTIDASQMLSSREAFILIDSLYNATHVLTDLSKTKLNDFLTPNIFPDVAADNKYKKLEYLNISGAKGIIKQGQRIVDRGEIITPQIYTNLQTYEDMMQKQNDKANIENSFFIGQTLYLILVFSMLYIFLSIYRSRFFADIRKMTFLISFITLFSILTILLSEHISNGIYLAPFAAIPIIIVIFFDSRTAIFALITTILVCTLVAPYQFQFMLMQLIVGLVATFSIKQLTRRSQLLRTALLALIAYIVIYIITMILEEGNLNEFSWRLIGVFAINSVILSFTYVLIFLIEKIFGFTSIVTLIELSDINNKLLRQLAEEAPGTFQHSMQVSTLAAEAAHAIGANTQLVRTGALYHDIGKMDSPIFFTENQHGVNPHDGLEPETSARKIVSHIAAGLARASKEKLPEVIRSFISEHHGKGVAKYFYATECNNNPDKTIDPAPYSYPGPNPQSKETAILMMADAIEAASRSLKEYTNESISILVDKIIDSQIADGMFKESPISLKEIEVVKKTFKKRLSTIYHSRVEYPDLKNKQS